VMSLVAFDKLDEAHALATAELAARRADKDRWGEAMMLLCIGHTNMDKRGPNHREEGAECAKQARALFSQLGSKKWEAEALNVLSFCASKRGNGKGDSQEALALAGEARELAFDIGDRRLEGQCLHYAAAAHAAAGDLDEALRIADEALDVYLELKDKRFEAFELIAMARWHLQAGNFDGAISDAEDALEIYQQVKSSKEVYALSLVFSAHLEKGDRRRALRTAREGVKRLKAKGDTMGHAFALDLLVTAYMEAGQADDALDAAQRALSFFQDAGNRRMEAKMSSAIAALYLRMSKSDRSLQYAEDAAMLYRETGAGTTEKTEALFNICESHIQRKDPASALMAAEEMRAHFQKEGDTQGEAVACLVIGQLSLTINRPDDTIANAAKAQALASGEGQQLGEAAALRLMAEGHSKKEEHKVAIRSAERSRAIFRELGETDEEASSLYLVAQESVALAVAEGACVGGGAGSRLAGDALRKAAKAADMTVKMARAMQDPGGLLGSALCVLAQVHMLYSRPEEALTAADEAVVIFRELDSAISEANALLLSADALRVTRQYRDAGEAAEEALRLFRTLDPPDLQGEDFAQEILDYLEQVKAQQQQQAQLQQAMMAQSAGAAMPSMSMTAPQEGPGGGVPAEVVSMARTDRERGPALDLSSGIDPGVIKAKVLEIATRITGAEDGEIDADTPLMEAGLTSNSAILLRDELSADLPGVSLPVTLVFDYPSISAMADLIVESSNAKAIKG